MNYEEFLKECKLCPHKCMIDRTNGKVGRCRASDKIKVALADLHFYEEPSISGETGSGTVFFSGCNLSCKFCQNYKISQELLGNEITVENLADMFLNLQERNANNINLVTGFMFIPQIIEAISIAREKGLHIPIVYNSSGYESKDALKLLDGYIDVYLPDFKYYDDELGKRLSGISNYFEIAKEALEEMYRQVGSPNIDEETGLIKKGMIIRHLILPNNVKNTKDVLRWIKDKFANNVLVSIMAQYFPSNKASEIEEINRKISQEEYDEVEELVFELDLEGYMQDLEDNEEQYVPDFEKGCK